VQGKLKRLQEHDIDLEAGSSKKLVTSASKQQEESPTQPEARQAAGDKPSFKVIGHFVMAMKRFQGIGRKLLVSSMALLLSFCLQGSKRIYLFAASLNPTYTYGKVQEDSTGSSASSNDFIHPAQRVLRVSLPCSCSCYLLAPVSTVTLPQLKLSCNLHYSRALLKS